MPDPITQDALIKELARLTQHGVAPSQMAVGAAEPIKATLGSSTPPTSQTGFRWGRKSQREFEGVNVDLVMCATLALTKYSRIDFCCFDGIRTVAEQRSHVKNGTSRTMKSKHLDGLALDLVPIIGGIPKWDWDGCMEIALAMDEAATDMGIAHRITWGAAWDRTLADYGGSIDAYRKEIEAYKARHPGPDFIDGPHFEITAK